MRCCVHHVSLFDQESPAHPAASEAQRTDVRIPPRKTASIRTSTCAVFTFVMFTRQRECLSSLSPPGWLQLKKLAEVQYDVLVIGGGATGSGVALDCATRGLKVAMVERDDFASGTSSKSTKLIHGGIRYLAQVHTPASMPPPTHTPLPLSLRRS